MRVEPVAMNWHTDLPIFARESFLRAVGDECGWLGGIADSGELRCVLPYTVIRKAFLRMVRFRVETFPMEEELKPAEEKEFLNGAMEYFRSAGADLVIPASTNAIFRTYPDGADAAPYGSYIIDLSPPEETLWKNIDDTTRRNIKTAQKNGMIIRSGLEHGDAAYGLIRETFSRSKLPFMSRESFQRYVQGLGENGLILLAEEQGLAQSYVVFGFSRYSAYAIYAGNAAEMRPGAIKFLLWESIRMFRNLGVQRFDFTGARINPEKGSKQDALAFFKRRFGATLKQGYIWKFALRPWKSRLYGLAARLRSGGDIVDAERHKLRDYNDLRNQ